MPGEILENETDEDLREMAREEMEEGSQKVTAFEDEIIIAGACRSGVIVKMLFLKYGAGVMKPRYLPATFSGCIPSFAIEWVRNLEVATTSEGTSGGF